MAHNFLEFDGFAGNLAVRISVLSIFVLFCRDWFSDVFYSISVLTPYHDRTTQAALQCENEVNRCWWYCTTASTTYF
jgi:hypothetical protein